MPFTENTFYPPCAYANLPLREGTYNVNYISHNHRDGKHYKLRFEYKNKGCDKKIRDCYLEKIEIRDSYTSYIWRNRTLPFAWFTWPENVKGTNWKREV